MYKLQWVLYKYLHLRENISVVSKLVRTSASLFEILNYITKVSHFTSYCFYRFVRTELFAVASIFSFIFRTQFRFYIFVVFSNMYLDMYWCDYVFTQRDGKKCEETREFNIRIWNRYTFPGLGKVPLWKQAWEMVLNNIVSLNLPPVNIL